MIFKLLKYMFLSVFGIVLFVAVGGFLFIKLSPEFGAEPTAKEKVSFENHNMRY